MATFKATFVTPEREVEAQARDDEYLLDVASEAGLELPFSCLQGWCTTCAGKLLEAERDRRRGRGAERDVDDTRAAQQLLTLLGSPGRLKRGNIRRPHLLSLLRHRCQLSISRQLPLQVCICQIARNLRQIA